MKSIFWVLVFCLIVHLAWAGDKLDSIILSDKLIMAPGVICFNFSDKDYKEVGQLCWEKGKFTFTGEADESAKLFFEYVKKHFEFGCK